MNKHAKAMIFRTTDDALLFPMRDHTAAECIDGLPVFLGAIVGEKAVRLCCAYTGLRPEFFTGSRSFVE